LQLREKLAAVIVAGAIFSLKVALMTTALGATPVALLSGVTDSTVGAVVSPLGLLVVLKSPAGAVVVDPPQPASAVLSRKRVPHMKPL